MSFNEISKMLDKNRIDQAKIKELEEDLLKKGITKTSVEAKEMASSMLKIEKSINQDYSKKKESLTNYNDPRNARE